MQMCPLFCCKFVCMKNIFEDTNVMNLLKKALDIQHDKVWKKIFSDEEFDEFVLDLVRIKQLYEKGIDENDKIIGYYSYLTEIINPIKKQGTPYTLKDTGEFYRSMKLSLSTDSFTIDADPIKIDKTGHETNLFEKFGEGIIGLNEESKQILIEEIKERFNNEFRRLLQ